MVVGKASSWSLLLLSGWLFTINGCRLPDGKSPDVTPVTHVDNIAGWLPAVLVADSASFVRLQRRVPSLTIDDGGLYVNIMLDGRFNAQLPDEVLAPFGASIQDTLLTLEGTWQYTTDNRQNVGVQFNSSQNPNRAFIGFLSQRKGRLNMVFAIGDLDSGNRLILIPR